METTQILVPGDLVDAGALPNAQKRKIGHGLHQLDNSDRYVATIAGPLAVDYRKKTANISSLSARYVPKAGDLVIAQVRSSGAEMFQLYINSHSQQAFLPHLAFEGASKKTRPQLKPNDLVYAKVVFAQKNMEVELSCVNPSTGKAEPDGLGPVNGGMLFDVSIGMSERMLKKQDVSFLEELGSKIQGGFEIAVGKNGKVWVDCPEAGVKGICAVGRCLLAVDEDHLQEKEQKKLVNRVCASLGIS
jgi:exosome complex component RRP40